MKKLLCLYNFTTINEKGEDCSKYITKLPVKDKIYIFDGISPSPNYIYLDGFYDKGPQGDRIAFYNDYFREIDEQFAEDVLAQINEQIEEEVLELI